MRTVSPRGGFQVQSTKTSRFNTKKRVPFLFYLLDYHPEKTKTADKGMIIDFFLRKTLTSNRKYGQYFLIPVFYMGER